MTDSLLPLSRLRASLGVILISSIASLLAILSIPRDPENAVLLGYSPARLGLVGLALFLVVLSAWLNWLLQRDSNRLNSWVRTIDKSMRHILLYSLTSLSALTVFGISAFALWMTFSSSNAQFRGYALRLAPFIGLGWLAAALLLRTMIWPYFWNVHFHKDLRQGIWKWVKEHLLFFILAPFFPLYRNRLKTMLRNNLIVLLFLPYGLTFAFILMYVRSMRWFDQPEYPVIAQHLVLSISPFLFVFLLGKRILADEIRTIVKTYITRFSQNWKTYLVFALVFIILYFALAVLHVPGIDARVRKFEYQPAFYLIQYFEPFFYIRVGNLLDLLVPLEFVSPLISFFFLMLWFAFLVYLNEDGPPSNVILTFLLTFSSAWGFIFVHYANMELPAAVMGTMGVFAFIRRRYNLGMLAFIISMIFKASSFFFIAAAGAVYLIYWARDWREIKKINFSLVFIAAIFLTLNYLPLFSYIAGRGGPGYIVAGSATMFWLSPAAESLIDFFTHYAPLSLAAFTAVFIKDQHRRAAVLLFLLAFAFRNISRLAGSYYSIFYLPPLSLLAFSTIRAGQRFLAERSPRSSFAVHAFIAIVALVYLGGTARQVNRVFLTRVNSNLTSTIQSLAAKLPSNAVVFERRMSLLSYFLRSGRADLQYDFYPENPEQVFKQLPAEGCVVWFSPADDLGITDQDLAAIGFDKHPGFYDQNQEWRLLLRDCDN